ncbi:MAG: hypothetical protein EBZ87_00110 [Microbacteriaceae bacterium]|nr:hypothetical protein [Microbacteriaceae bacterium]
MSFSMEGYVDVAERIRRFKAAYPNGCLRPFNPSEPFRIMEIGGREFIVYTAAAFRSPDDPCPGIAVAAEPAVGQTSFTKMSEVMNAETSAWGRAIVAVLAADSQRIASAEEVRNRQIETPREVSGAPITPIASPERKPSGREAAGASDRVSDKQLGLLNKLIRERGIEDALALASVQADKEITSLAQLSKKEASGLISTIMTLPADGQPETAQDEEPF